MAEPNGNPATRITLLRHAECEGGEIFRGSTDVPLSDVGWDRLTRVTEPLADWDHIVTSPLQRCRVFAEQLADKRRLPITVDARFREMNHGDWEGVERATIAAQPGNPVAAWRADPHTNAPPNSEPLPDVRARVSEALCGVVDEHAGADVLVVCHGGVIRNVLAWALDIPVAATNRLVIPYGCRSQLVASRINGQVAVRLLGHNLDDNQEYL